MVSFILPGNSASGGYEVANSLRLNNDSSDYLVRSLGSQSSLRIGTFSYWVKRSSTDIGLIYFNEVENDNNRGYIQFENDGTWRMVDNDNSGDHIVLKTNRLFHDFGSWYHICVRVDTTQSTSTDRVRLYVNGVQETSFSSTTYPSQNDDLKIFEGGQTNKNNLGAGYPESNYFDGYMAEFVYCDGQSLGPTSFGEFDEDSGIWKPIDVSGLTFGNNGFYLDFEDSSSLGNDAAGSNNFSVDNLTAIDQSTDTCTNNYCTMNPLNVPTSNQPTFSEGSLKTVSSSSASGAFGGSTTFGVSQGKWYVEAKATVGSTYSRNAIGVSYNPAEMARSNADTQISNTSYAWGWESSGGEVRHDASAVASYATYATGDICQIFLDLDNHKLYFGKNGTLQSSTGISLDTGETYFIVQTDRTGSSEVSTFEFNFGAGTTFSISSGNTDGEYGNFEYSTTITGDGASKTFKALNTKNLAEYG